MSLAKFSTIVVATLGLTSLVVALGVAGREGGGRMLVAAVSGAVLAGLNAVAAYGLVLWSRERSTVVFMRAILGGMTLRMGVMVGVSAIALRLFDLPVTAFLPSLLAHFALFLVLELTAAHRTVHPRETAQ